MPPSPPPPGPIETRQEIVSIDGAPFACLVAGGCGFHLARVALSHLALQLHSLLLAEAAEAEAAATAATAADTAAAVAAATASVPARLPAAYAELSALCNHLMCASATSS